MKFTVNRARDGEKSYIIKFDNLDISYKVVNNDSEYTVELDNIQRSQEDQKQDAIGVFSSKDQQIEELEKEIKMLEKEIKMLEDQLRDSPLQLGLKKEGDAPEQKITTIQRQERQGLELRLVDLKKTLHEKKKLAELKKQKLTSADTRHLVNNTKKIKEKRRFSYKYTSFDINKFVNYLVNMYNTISTKTPEEKRIWNEFFYRLINNNNDEFISTKKLLEISQYLYNNIAMRYKWHVGDREPVTNISPENLKDIQQLFYQKITSQPVNRGGKRKKTKKRKHKRKKKTRRRKK